MLCVFIYLKNNTHHITEKKEYKQKYFPIKLYRDKFMETAWLKNLLLSSEQSE